MYLADVIAMSGGWNNYLSMQLRQMLLLGWFGCYSHQGGVVLADGIARSAYFNLSSEMLCRTSSHMCGRWYLPIFLLRDGLFTLIYRASFMVLRRVLTFSSHYFKVVYSDIMTRYAGMVMGWGKGS